jgi:hypothetical protein
VAREDVVSEFIVSAEALLSYSVAANRRTVKFPLKVVFTAVTLQIPNSLVGSSATTFETATQIFSRPWTWSVD